MSHSWRRLCGSSPVVGSSRKRIFGLATSAVATASRCFCPPDSLPTQVSAFSSQRKLFQHSFDRVRDGGRSWRTASGFRGRSAFPRAASPAARCQSTRAARAHASARSCRGSRPRRTSAASRPSRISMVVVLPAPFGPSRPKHSPVSMVRSRPRTASTLPS